MGTQTELPCGPTVSEAAAGAPQAAVEAQVEIAPGPGSSAPARSRRGPPSRKQRRSGSRGTSKPECAVWFVDIKRARRW